MREIESQQVAMRFAEQRFSKTVVGKQDVCRRQIEILAEQSAQRQPRGKEASPRRFESKLFRAPAFILGEAFQRFRAWRNGRIERDRPDVCFVSRQILWLGQLR